MQSTFRSLRGYNYRAWAIGAFVSNVGTWMQRTAQDWIVLTALTAHSATAVGIVMALQFGPTAVLLPFAGFAADHFDRRKLLFWTQGAMGALALGLGLLTVTGAVTLWEVYAFALALGVATAFDAPARQTFVSELVGESDLSNAVALNSTSFNAARLIGPAVAGTMIHVLGSGWVFLLNAASYVAVLASLRVLRVEELHRGARVARAHGNFVEGLRYVRGRPDLVAVLAMLFLIGTFGLNFPIFLSTMSVMVFHAGAREYGLLTSTMAVGSVLGALLSAGQERPRTALLLGGAAAFGVGCAIAALMPDYWLFGAVLVAVGISVQVFNTTANATMQLSTDPVMRGRVMALVMAIALGGTPIGAPLVGWVADTFGPRWSLGVGAASGLLAAAVGVRYLVRHRRLSVRLESGRLRFRLAPSAIAAAAAAAEAEVSRF
ncbi:MAG: MFS transporter [Burkholderiaceae bacterium]